MFEWKFIPKWYLQGSHGYRVSRSADNKKFFAWPPAPKAPPSFGYYNWIDHVHNMIDVFDSADLAKQACVDHYNESICQS